MGRLILISLSFVILFTTSACSGEETEWGEQDARDLDSLLDKDRADQPACLRSLYLDKLESVHLNASCKKANQTQLAQVNLGNDKKDQFLAQCYQETQGSCWCDQLIRPNPESINTFHCTYGNDQPHQLIHPDESTWSYAFEAVKIIEEFAQVNLQTRIIHNWWRPEPYNDNVGGSATRHPFGTSIDIKLETKAMQNLAFQELCKMKKKGRIRAIGYYTTTAIHIGVGDKRANTWGKLCP